MPDIERGALILTKNGVWHAFRKVKISEFGLATYKYQTICGREPRGFVATDPLGEVTCGQCRRHLLEGRPERVT